MRCALRVLSALLFATQVHCGAPADTELEIEALRAGSMTDAVRSCLKISDEGRRSFCIADGVRTLGRDDPETASAYCLDIQSAAWRAECFFYAADHLAANGDYEHALIRCDNAMLFQANCVMHVFAEVARSLQANQPLGEAAENFTAALSLLEASSIRRDDALDKRLWLQFFQEALPPADEISTTHCNALKPKTRSKCINGAKLRLTQQLHTALRVPGAVHDACDRLDTVGLRAAAQHLEVRYAEQPELDAAVENTLQRACRHRPASGQEKGPHLEGPP